MADTQVLQRRRRLTITHPDTGTTKVRGAWRVRVTPTGDDGRHTVELVDGRGAVQHTLADASFQEVDRRTARAVAGDGTTWLLGCTCGG